jgi:hypothetical protein
MTDLERSPGREPPVVPAWEKSTTDIDAPCPGSPASGIREPEGRKPDFDPAIAFLGDFGCPHRTLYLASRLAAIRVTAAHDELIAANVLA